MSDMEMIRLLDEMETYETTANSYSNAMTTSPLSFSMPTYFKFQTMFFVFAEMLLVALLGLRCIEKGNKLSRVLAIMGMVFCVLSAALQILLIWELFPFMESFTIYTIKVSMAGKTMLFLTISMIILIVGALVARIKENETIIRVLKWITIGCWFGVWLSVAIMIFADDSTMISKMMGLSVIALSCFVVCLVTSLVLSRFSRKEDGGKIETNSVQVAPIQNQDSMEYAQRIEVGGNELSAPFTNVNNTMQG